MQAGNPRLLFAGITIYSFSRGIYTWVWFVCLFVLGTKQVVSIIAITKTNSDPS